MADYLAEARANPADKINSPPPARAAARTSTPRSSSSTQRSTSHAGRRTRARERSFPICSAGASTTTSAPHLGVLPFIKDGKLRGLAISSTRRSGQLTEPAHHRGVRPAGVRVHPVVRVVGAGGHGPRPWRTDPDGLRSPAERRCQGTADSAGNDIMTMEPRRRKISARSYARRSAAASAPWSMATVNDSRSTFCYCSTPIANQPLKWVIVSCLRPAEPRPGIGVNRVMTANCTVSDECRCPNR